MEIRKIIADSIESANDAFSIASVYRGTSVYSPRQARDIAFKRRLRKAWFTYRESCFVRSSMYIDERTGEMYSSRNRAVPRKCKMKKVSAK